MHRSRRTEPFASCRIVKFSTEPRIRANWQRMWLIRTALRRPYTFVVMAMLIAIGGLLSIRRTPTDIFPSIDIPVISVIWRYGGLQPEEMEKRIVNNFERFLTTIVSDIDHMESQSLTGIAVIKVYLQPGANVEQAIAQ